jgi:methionyl-tRNA formyltransferase
VKLAVLVDSDQTIARWQFNALQEVISDGHEINILATAKGDAPKSRKKIKHVFYYVFAILNRYKLAQLNRVSIHDLGLEDALQVDFERETKGIWEEIPANSLSGFSASDVVVKFGMGLLRNPHLIPVKYGVLSYHHGNPSKYRGRPAGFWESVNSESSMGVIVQSLTNNLDAGEIKAIGFSRINQTSYRKTLSEVYATGTPLLRKAISNLASDSSIASSVSNKTTTLPSNAKVIQLSIMQLKNRVARYAYGAFFEKKWRVGFLPLLGDLESHSTIKAQELELIPVPSGYMMTADPCGELLDGLYCELLNNKTGLGEIGIWKQGSWHHLDIGIAGHASYPQIVQWNNLTFLFPEVSSGSSPVLIELGLDGKPSGKKMYLKNLEDKKLVDGTLFESNGSWFLFAGNSADSHQRLELYYSSSLDSEFQAHPMSPIVLDPRASRMAGPIVKKIGSIYRFGQDCSERYGGGITISRVTELKPNSYREERVGSLSLKGALGPHSLLIGKDKIWLDFYTEKFALAAGLRRIKARFF